MTKAKKRPMDWLLALSQPVEKGGLRLGPKGGTMEASCWHKRKSKGACAGCYARTLSLLWALSDGAGGRQGKALAGICEDAMRRDKDASQ
jgi:hypothetical protein